ncbi:MAG TPA: DoxX family protein, partial [Mycobacterium sp.]|nr:DoxX family protein [Mycobacterium sp.]
MLIRRIARPLLSVAFIGQGVESLLNPKSAAEAAAPTVDGLQALPDPVGSKVPSDPQTFAQINATVQIGGGLLLASGKLPRVASAALAFTVLPANLGTHMFWTESDPQRKAELRQAFLKDLSLLGGLVIASADTAGKPSLGWRGRRAAARLSER